MNERGYAANSKYRGFSGISLQTCYKGNMSAISAYVAGTVNDFILLFLPAPTEQVFFLCCCT